MGQPPQPLRLRRRPARRPFTPLAVPVAYAFFATMALMKMKEMHRIAAEEMAKIGITITDPEQAVGTMSGGQRQTLAIARAIYFGAKVLILDEPTSALGQKQQMEVLKTIRRVQQLGDIAIILITHNEIHARLIADRFTFLSLFFLVICLLLWLL